MFGDVWIDCSTEKKTAVFNSPTWCCEIEI